MLSIFILIAVLTLLSLSMPKQELGFSFSNLASKSPNEQRGSLFNGKMLAVVTQGILGKVNGKVGGVVGRNWKGINTLAGYVKPSNPNTPGQQLVRNRFKAMQALASQFLPTIVEIYWNPFAVGQSGYNAFISANNNALANDTYYLTTNNTFAKGNLETLKTPQATLANNLVTLTWSKATTGNGLTTDNVSAVVVNKETNAAYFLIMDKTRNDEEIAITVTGESDATKLLVFPLVDRGTGSSFIVANGQGIQVTV